ncbi:ADAM 17-like protease [Mercenaria mercenaria]|uniref:ADAM 17-like protease n=1 Tax=Mercenaria mercenaria TaxID=6596 RepID=UPI00234F66AB|nr:ADAM 17-like protease [Mercenaria mercenaria]
MSVKMEVAVIVLHFVNFLFISTVAGNIQDRLRYFETLKTTDFTHRVKRSIDPDPYSSSHITEVKVTTLGREFHLYLKPSNILSYGFKASIVGGNGISHPFHINRGSLLTGNLAGDTSAVANVNYEENGALLANIVTKEDTYIIEPSWRLLPESDNHTMVSYKKSDMKFEYSDDGQHIHPVCGIKEGEKDDELHGRIEVPGSESQRYRRQASPYLAERTTCQLMVVADYKFFKHMGGSSAAATALYLINVIQFVNTIYRQTQFDVASGSMIGVGFEIGEMRIHNESYPATTTLQGKNHYNIEKGKWDTKNLLEAFSFDQYFRKYCLAHLFTYRQFDDGVLGLAYIASERRAAVGGLCSKLYPKYAGVTMTLNTGWSSSQNSAGHRLLALQAQLVTAHEFGHNMGSEHDPETDDCAPSEYKDGKYMMYPWAVSGYDKNNQLFSPCSKAYIFKVLKVKGYNCFIEGRGDGAFCGNGRIDADEECDAGYHTKNDDDLCCNEQCKLRAGMKCSPMNYGCCSPLCQPADTSVTCRPALEGSCLDEIKCDGIHITCPNITNNIQDGTDCIDQGKCKDGQCQNFCERYDVDLTPCICAEDTGKACHRCCRHKYQQSTCESINNTLLPDGRPCYQGICNQGTCQKVKRDMVQRLFNIIEDISIDQLVEFMRSNIVGTVIVLSLLLWIPASCTISFIDKKNNRKEKAKRNWMSRSNRTLFMEEDFKVRRVPNIRAPKHSIAVRNRDSAEPTVRWPEGTFEHQSRPMPRPINPAILPRPVQPVKPMPFSEATAGFINSNTEALDIGPDLKDPDKETRV